MTTVALADYRRDRAFEAERATLAPLQSVSTLAILDLARLYHEQPEDALRIADASRKAYEAHRASMLHEYQEDAKCRS